MSLRETLRALSLLFLAAAGHLPAQAPADIVLPSSAGSALAVAESYEAAFDQLMGLRGMADRVATVEKLVLQRDVGRFTLGAGRLYLLSPVGGRTVAAVFQGTGTFSFAPGSRGEQQRLARIEQTTSLEAPVSSLVFLFADSTLAELERTLSFGPAEVPAEVRGRAQDALGQLSDRDSRTVHPDLMSALLNGEHSDLFCAYIRRSGGGPLLFMLNPNEVEAVTLAGKLKGRHWSREPEVISRFPRQAALRPGITGERVRQADVQRYAIETWLPPTGIGEIGFSAVATLDIVADTAVGPWVAFSLFEELRVDSARWSGGERATVFRGRDSDLLWVRLDREVRPGDVRPLTLYYRGNLIDRFVDFFRIKSSIAWYPRSLEGRSLARFDLTFHTSDAYLLASVGDRVDSTRSGRTVRTRWVTPGPIRNASFNLGLFKDYSVREAGVPPVTVMVSEEAHRKLSRVFVQQRKMRERVGTDVIQSLRFFQEMYGPAPVKHFYATEIPDFHGEAFPGMVHLSWATFQNTSDDGADEVFRAHEVAHQWWGIGVDFASYHDQWLSEGFSTFSGLWYLQAARKDNDMYFDMLRQWRSSILLREGDPGPISLGYRVFASKDDDQNDYQTIIYKKGAWVVHMLRVLMLDLKTMREDRFTGMMRDIYRKYEGRRASTDDFRRVVERHANADLGWFFDQWVHSTAVSTYRVAQRIEPTGDGQFKVRLQIRQENVPEDFQAYVPVTVDLGKNGTARVRVKVKGPRSDIELPLMPAQPKGVKFNDLEGVLAEVKTAGWED
ncbi:MAG: hypothetical protein H0T68_09185 [Gemmatimonadales bacterium]|nr:hypothetical protein [Gemmatimonadales bacterium]